jgi:hypothetical protein
VGRDTFAFANLVRAHRPGLNDGFANYCLLMARAATQFFRAARFDPAGPTLAPEDYAARVREVLATDPWAPPRPPGARVAFPGYADLHAFSRAHEALLKAALGRSWPSMAHWRNWRVAVALSGDHQEGVARELVGEAAAGRPAPVMLTNYPEPDLLNHAVLVYGARPRPGRVEFLAYDPNDPGAPLSVHFEAATRAFWVGPLPYAPPGRVRAFRLYASPWL